MLVVALDNDAVKCLCLDLRIIPFVFVLFLVCEGELYFSSSCFQETLFITPSPHKQQKLILSLKNQGAV